jgi:hypothetical protein
MAVSINPRRCSGRLSLNPHLSVFRPATDLCIYIFYLLYRYFYGVYIHAVYGHIGNGRESNHHRVALNDTANESNLAGVPCMTERKQTLRNLKDTMVRHNLTMLLWRCAHHDIRTIAE